jgi:predicted GIY-YIG superfamily endonuclease
MYTVYILLCEDGTLYTGIARNAEARLKQHRAGTGARYTRAHAPVRIVYTEHKRSRSGALKREAAIKAMTRAQKDRLVAGMPL